MNNITHILSSLAPDLGTFPVLSSLLTNPGASLAVSVALGALAAVVRHCSGQRLLDQAAEFNSPLLGKIAFLEGAKIDDQLIQKVFRWKQFALAQLLVSKAPNSHLLLAKACVTPKISASMFQCILEEVEKRHSLSQNELNQALCAVICSHEKVEKKIDLLFSRGAEVNCQVNGYTPLQFACRRKCLDSRLIDKLLTKHAQVDANLLTLLLYCVIEGGPFGPKKQLLALLIQDGADVGRIIEKQKWTPLHYAFLKSPKSPPCFDSTVGRFFKRSVKDIIQPIIEEAKRKNYLHSLVNFQDHLGKTALHYAVEKVVNDPSIGVDDIQYLLDCGARMLCDAQGNSPISYAKMHPSILQVFHRYNRINDQDHLGKTALHYAVEKAVNDPNASFDDIKLLLDCGASLILDSQGRSPTDYAVNNRLILQIFYNKRRVI